jgi:hypothetical protein
VRITYDRQTDTLSVVLKEDVAVAEAMRASPASSSITTRPAT